MQIRHNRSLLTQFIRPCRAQWASQHKPSIRKHYRTRVLNRDSPAQEVESGINHGQASYSRGSAESLQSFYDHQGFIFDDVPRKVYLLQNTMEQEISLKD